jgi:hypothetical protein
VHHRTIQINHQPDETIFQFIILTFIHSSTCFVRFPANHLELDDCSGSLWFYLRIVVSRAVFVVRPAALVLPSYRGDSRAVFVVGPPGPTTRAGWPDHEHGMAITTIRR